MSISDSTTIDEQTDSTATNRRQQAAVALLDDLQSEKSLRLAEREGQPVRMDMVNQIRQQIMDGNYESDEKVDLAIDRLLVDLDPR